MVHTNIFNKIKYKSDAEIELIKLSALLVGQTLGEVAKHIRPGIPLIHLDRIAEEFIRDHHGIPSFKGYDGFPASLCLSVNDVVVHGIPSNEVLNEGDIISVDCGAILNGYHGDYAYTFEVGEVSEDVHMLVERTKESLYVGIEAAKEGNHIGDISHAVESYIRPFHYGIVEELCGHGIGTSMHEKPDIPNYGRPGVGPLIKRGMVFCIEPMICLGRRRIYMDNDGWTIHTYDRKPAAHFEHQLAVTENGTEVISTYKYIEEALNNS